jgi:acetolactate synthase I/II/III large subunit
MNGAQALFKALTDAGVTTCFANPGTSEMQLVYEIGTANVRPILCLQEDVVTGAADGYARMKGSPAVTLLHVGSGFANGIAMLHTPAEPTHLSSISSAPTRPITSQITQNTN